MWPYPWTHVGTPSHRGHMDRVAATMPSQAHAGAAQEAPDIGQWEGQDVPLVRPSSCNVKGGIPSSRRYLPTYLIEQRKPKDGDTKRPSLGALRRPKKTRQPPGPAEQVNASHAESWCGTNTSKVIPENATRTSATGQAVLLSPLFTIT